MKINTDRFYRVVFLAALGVSMLGCSTTKERNHDVPNALSSASSTCAILESAKWHAWLDRYQQEPGSYRLNVWGEVTLPNRGYDLQWSVGATDKMNPPGLRLFLTPLSTGGISAQVITAVAVNYEMQTPISNYRNISVYCGDIRLGHMLDVMLTD